MKNLMKIAAVLGVVLLATSAFGATTTHVATPGQVPDETEPRVNVGDSPVGYEVDSWQGPSPNPTAPPGAKTNWHARYLLDGDYLSAIFPTEAATLTMNDIARISYYTNRPAGTSAGQDWWIQIYTRPDGVGDCSGWYGYRFINDYGTHTDTSGTWVQYSTPAMLFRESSCGGGGYQTLAAQQGVYGNELIEMFSVQTDSGWNGYDGYIDGLEIELTNGSIGRVNFEGYPPLPATGTWALIGLFALLAAGLLVVLVQRQRRATA